MDCKLKTENYKGLMKAGYYYYLFWKLDKVQQLTIYFGN